MADRIENRFKPQEGFESPHLLPTKIGKYLLLDKIGDGGMAEIYLAKSLGDSGFEKMLAIKRILPIHTRDPDACRMFEFEAKLCSSLSHPNIVHIYDYIRSSDSFLIIMEFVAGKNIAELLDRLKENGRPLPTECALYIVGEILKALDYAHTRRDDRTDKLLNIIHRDISPRNIMISYDSIIKLLDFGIAKARDRSRLTQAGLVRGTIRYISPERALGHVEDCRSDLFSVGLVFFELLAGKSLFDGPNQFVMLKSIQSCGTTCQSVDELDVPNELKYILHRALAKDPEQRYPTAAAFHLDLQEYFQQNFSSLAPKKLAKIVTDNFGKQMLEERRKIQTLETRSDRESHSRSFPVTGLTADKLGVGKERQASPRISLNSLVGFTLLVFAVGFTYFLFKAGKVRVPVQLPLGHGPKQHVQAPLGQRSILPVGQCQAIVESRPVGARLLMNGIFIGETPTKVQVDCEKNILLTLERVGFVTLNRKVQIVTRDSRMSLTLLPLEPSVTKGVDPAAAKNP